MREIAYIQAINEALREEMERDETVFIIGEDVQAGVFRASTGLVKQFGTDRVMDTPLSETAVAGAALGAAMAGYRPVADFMFADFMWCAADEVFLKAAERRQAGDWEAIEQALQMANIDTQIAMCDFRAETTRAFADVPDQTRLVYLPFVDGGINSHLEYPSPDFPQTDK